MLAGEKSPVWHPFAQHGIVPSFPEIIAAEGVHLMTRDGARIIDAISSWWVITHGHCHPRIVAAIKSASDQLDQIIFANYTHPYAEDLAKQLVAVTPKPLSHVFYTDSGSTSVEVALKMALGYWRNIGAPRHRIVVLENSYHGDTVGAMSVGARGIFSTAYEPLLFDVEALPFPRPGAEQVTLDALERVCRSPSDRPAALIVEPLLLGAGGMLMYDRATLHEMRRICATHDVLFIADEVMTGWGRTGQLFAMMDDKSAPDIVCYAKGLTGGALPLAVTMCTSPIFEAHLSTDRAKTFFHSSSFTANPIACAAALENLRIWQDEPVAARIQALCQSQAQQMTRLSALTNIEATRQLGTVTAFDVVVERQGYLAEIGPQLMQAFAQHNVLLRPLGSTVYVMPIYATSDSDLAQIYDAIIDEVGRLAA